MRFVTIVEWNARCVSSKGIRGTEEGKKERCCGKAKVNVKIQVKAMRITRLFPSFHLTSRSTTNVVFVNSD